MLSRIAWMFVGKGHARLARVHPGPARAARRRCGTTFLFYLLPAQAAPTPPSGTTRSRRLAYIVVFRLYLVMIVTGLGLYGVDAGVGVAGARGLGTSC